MGMKFLPPYFSIHWVITSVLLREPSDVQQYMHVIAPDEATMIILLILFTKIDIGPLEMAI